MPGDTDLIHMAVFKLQETAGRVLELATAAHSEETEKLLLRFHRELRDLTKAAMSLDGRSEQMPVDPAGIGGAKPRPGNAR